MFVIGLTGDAGSGKSTVASMLRQLGARVVSADAIARAQAAAGTPVHTALVRAFGERYLTAEGEVDRRKLAALVFRDKEARVRLNNITHPPVMAAVRREIETARRRGPGVLVVEIPLLFETGAAALFDAVWVVTADRPAKMARLQARGLTGKLAAQMLDSQLPQAQKVQRADRVIDNSGSLEHTREQVAALWKDLR